SQQRIVKAQRYRAILAEREQQARVAEERTRNEIARELHDIVAHSLSVMIVQAEGGKALATKKPEKAP
ncbi:histidine kinase, partial [Escherichia coli]